jgi:chromate transporter
MLTTDHGPGSLRKSEKGDWMEVASPANPETDGRDDRGSLGEVFQAFLKLGVTSFGGPIAHLGYFRHELVERRKWIDEAVYADLIALCQFLPGPASSQVGFSLGILRGHGLLGGLAAWFAFTMSSAAILRDPSPIVRRCLSRGRRAPSIRF